MTGWLWWLLILAGILCVIVVMAVIERRKQNEVRKRSNADPLMEASFENIIELRDQGVVNEWRLKDLRHRRPDLDAWLDDREGTRRSR